MTLDFQSIVNLVATGAFGVVAYLYHQIVTDAKKDREMINDMRVDIPTNYVRKDELSAHLVRIENMLNKIWERLDQKQDK